jgi:oxalate decarboxylase/phosphoglucose isomerase-like protein (cupin superfamily)
MLANPPHGIYKGGREWRVDSSRFPISTTVTGVVLDLEPGALRELHWHPNADEWQYVIEGAISVTMFGSHGRCELRFCTRAMSASSRQVMGTPSKMSVINHARINRL